MSYRHAYEKLSEFRVRCMSCYHNIITLDKPAPDSLEYCHYYSCELCRKEDDIITNSGYYEFKDREKQERNNFKVGKFNLVVRYRISGKHFLHHSIVNIIKVCPKSIIYDIYHIKTGKQILPCRRKITHYYPWSSKTERVLPPPNCVIEGVDYINADDLYLINEPWIERQKEIKKQKEAVEIISNAFLEWKYNPIYKYCKKIQQRLYEEEFEPNKVEFKKIITEDMRLKLKSLNLTAEELYEFTNM